MKLEYDKIADAVYLQLNIGRVAKTIQLKDRLNVDVDGRGKVLGVEILDASNQVSKDRLSQVEVGLSTGIKIKSRSSATRKISSLKK